MTARRAGKERVIRRSSGIQASARRVALAALRAGAVALAFVAFTSVPAATQEAEREEVLPGSGIRYPLGYDPETEGSVEGRVLRVDVPQRGPVVLQLESGGRTAKVLVSPAWFWEAAEGRPGAGDTVTVLGSKTLGADGEFYLVAREIESAGSGCTCSFRDGGGQPLWRGRRHGAPPRRCRPHDASPAGGPHKQPLP